MNANLTSVSPIISYLEEEDPKLQTYALKKLNELVDQFWPEIADSIGLIEKLCEDQDFVSKELASLVASKVYYHLGSMNEALNYALAAGDLFDLSNKSEFVETIVAKCIDEYILIRSQTEEEKSQEQLRKQAELLFNIENVISKMFQRCFEDGEFKQAIGIAIESKRLDLIKETIYKSGNIPETLEYCLKITNKYVLKRSFRQQILQLLIEIYQSEQKEDHIRICELLLLMEDTEKISEILMNLIDSEKEIDILTAYQIGFDLCENAGQKMLSEIKSRIPDPIEEKQQTKMQEEKKLNNDNDNDNDEKKLEEKTEETKETPKPNLKPEKIKKLKAILNQEYSLKLLLQFLNLNNHTDFQILRQIKTKMDTRKIALRTTTVTAHGFMQAGTTVDSFLRGNLEWLRKINNWGKFSSTASLGVIHKGHIAQALDLLSPYLPQNGRSESPYSEAGALYALGIINVNHGETSTPYLLNMLRSLDGNEILQHGACLGLGLSAMGTLNEEIYEDLKAICYSDSAIAGETAGLAMGLVMLGSASESAIQDMLVYAHETQHEKIIRSLAIGISLIMYGKEEAADTLIEQLLLDKDPILRYGAMYTIAMAYAGTSNDKALKRLLHVGVSDVNDDVRRAAVIAIAFLLFKEPEQIPQTLSLLSKSYNPHVRFGAAISLGIGCSSVKSLQVKKQAIDLLFPLTKDPVDFVRQGSFLGLAMVLMQINELQEPRAKLVRDMFFQSVSDKAETLMAKIGAILGAGIIDAGGRNVVISLQTNSGMNDITSIVGLSIFTQFWFWHPFVHLLSLSFQPTALIGLNINLEMPKFKVKSNANPDLFAYPKPLEISEQKKDITIEKAVLSFTAKALKREEMKKEKKQEENQENQENQEIKENQENQENQEIKENQENQEIQKKDIPKKENFEILQNPTRITLIQRDYVSLDIDERYRSIKSNAQFGVILLHDTKPDENEELVIVEEKIQTESPQDEGEEPEPPEPFEWIEDLN
ncbi:26s proteasome non-atpase regulatory subunit 1 [Anaeramoeba ignava]|uniref:26s proteasome non-atpase regulatory subunit 1 n=1 Tax=Anaeramoeba ignava TaxID=1746090 RepID=A0A9Q0LII4_ANAIG|nr:26s proteasome non-atpase regulatory subunit 1 [Anaeramoeba ignava]